MSAMGKSKFGYGIHATKACGSEYDLQFTEDNIPYLKCSGCGYVVDDWVRWKHEYSSLYKDEDAWRIRSNHVACLLGYFCYVYEQHYGFEYVLSLGPSGLFRGAEAVFIRKILSHFSSDALQAKQYIDWFFKKKVQDRKKKLSSLSALTVPSVVGLYKHDLVGDKRIYRSAKLPAKMSDWLRTKTPSLIDSVQLDDYGDLNVFLSYCACRGRDVSEDMAKFLKVLYKNKVIDSELKIIGYTEE